MTIATAYTKSYGHYQGQMFVTHVTFQTTPGGPGIGVSMGLLFQLLCDLARHDGLTVRRFVEIIGEDMMPIGLKTKP